MEPDLSDPVTHSPCPPANRARESASTRRLRTFLGAASAFDCELNESEFDALLRAIAPSRPDDGVRRYQNGDVRGDSAGVTNETQSVGHVGLPSRALGLGPAAASRHRVAK